MPKDNGKRERWGVGFRTADMHCDHRYFASTRTIREYNVNTYRNQIYCRTEQSCVCSLAEKNQFQTKIQNCEQTEDRERKQKRRPKGKQIRPAVKAKAVTLCARTVEIHSCSAQ